MSLEKRNFKNIIPENNSSLIVMIFKNKLKLLNFLYSFPFSQHLIVKQDFYRFGVKKNGSFIGNKEQFKLGKEEFEHVQKINTVLEAGNMNSGSNIWIYNASKNIVKLCKNFMKCFTTSLLCLVKVLILITGTTELVNQKGFQSMP